MKRLWWRRLLWFIAIAICVLPPLGATFKYASAWMTHGEGVEGIFNVALPGVAVVVGIFCAIPLFKYISRIMKSPSMWFVWTFMWVITEILVRVIDEMRVITFVGAVCNIIGFVLWHISNVGMGRTKE